MESSTPSETAAGKRKRSPSSSSAIPSTAPAPKVSKPSSNQLSINYLSRQSSDDLPLLGRDDTLPNLLQLLTAYSNVLDRHESLASNLGARPLGPILIKRFERCFDAPPKIVASHHKGSTNHPEESTHTITWLEVIEFARAHPGQFTLSTFSEGRRVCQFYYPQKQLRVQISEEDFLFINSGRCQELIPPLPIWEDEEKEVGTCDVLEAKLKELTNAADTVAARTRQLSHRLKGRRAAILERRADGGSGTPAKAGAVQTTTAPPTPSSSGFVAVNTANGKASGDSDSAGLANVRSELLRHFESLPQNNSQGRPHSRHQSIATYLESTQHHADHAPEQAGTYDTADSITSSLSPVPPPLPSETFGYSPLETTASRPTAAHYSTGHRASLSTGGPAYNVGHTPSKHNFSRPLPPALESSQPFRPLCQAHMDRLPRGRRVLPPCDRCRRLRMDCVKNLTSCAGCTKKHARCHWRDVKGDDIGDLDQMAVAERGNTSFYSSVHYDDPVKHLNGYANGGGEHAASEFDARYSEESDDDDSNPLEDLEALGEKEEQREKELAERMREDEEGLRNARELARQGREDSIRSFQSINHLTTNDPVAADTAPNGTLHAEPQQTSENDTNSAIDVGHDYVQPLARSADAAAALGPSGDGHAGGGEVGTEVAQLTNGDAKAAAAFVPLYPEIQTAAHGGFHAVNEPGTGVWR
ncbi:hypothetical protein LTR36_000003 [Oleoguttula mirabilis]|uniref:Zn(2)-C6 fungal-type domain-containing protein n=1 Tax=Oleoguttula mirabilis TaxID=1507867 RepID=A0AAV9JYJ7_9PEZI|nr:hypothetical protein LTR36_000003 [Oleoguttula mirabilis]